MVGAPRVLVLASPGLWQELADGRWVGPRPSKLDPFKAYLDQHPGGGRGDITRLFREITALGYEGSYPVVRHYLARNRTAREPLPPARRPSATSRTGSAAARTP